MAPVFRRDPVTVLAYSALAAYALVLYGLGPQLAFLRDELHLSYSVTSLHSVLFAAGAVVTGLLFGLLSRRLGRRRVLWFSAAGMAFGTLLFSVSHVLPLTLLSAAILGLAGTTLLSSTTVVLSDRHGVQRDRALVEANILASASALCAPLLLSFLDRTPAGWRAELVVPALAIGLIYLFLGRVPMPVPVAATRKAAAGSKLPPAFWVLIALVALVVGTEFSVVFFGASLVHVTTGVEVAVAAGAMGFFYGGELVGRIAGTGLTRSPGRGTAIVAGALVVTAVGFVMLWTATSLPLAAAGLFVTGLGVANLYPLSLAMTLALVPGLVDMATARVQVMVGAAVLSAPFALAAAADRAGVHTAFVLVLVLVVLATGLLIAARAAASRR